jgi:tRNA pseudouridine38-40 synthase
VIRYKIKIEYDGTDYAGWQRQDNMVSVQSAIEDALYKFSQENVQITGSGRTDSGVHATGQVAHFDLNKSFEIKNVINGINFFLKPQPISILDCQIVDKNFHARFSAKKRYYRYFILNRNSPAAIDAKRKWWIRESLDIELMQKAAKLLEGTHDFSSFRTSQCQAKSPIKTLDYIRISQFGEFIEIALCAESFLHRMVRNIVGCLRMIGNKRWLEKDLLEFIEAKTTAQTRYTAPPHGLFLEKIEY